MQILASRSSLPCLLLASGALAQGAVSPQAFATAEGNAGHAYAFGSAGFDGYLAVHDDMAGRPQTIRAIRLRLDGQQPLPNFDIHFRCDVLMSTAVTTGATVSSNFAANHGNDAQWVGQGVDVVLHQPGNELPRRFELVIPLTTPFQFGGQGPLCWEVQMVGQLGTQNFALDWVSSSSTGPRSYEMGLGGACRGFNLPGPGYLGTSHRTDATGRLVGIDLAGMNFQPGDFAALLLGDNSSFGGVPLPFIIPGTPQGLSGPCALFVAPAVIVPVITSATGTALVPLDLPPSFPNGVNLFAQYLAHDDLANATHVITSNAVQMNLVAPWSTLPIGSAEYIDATSRIITRRGQGYVVRFD